MTTWNELYGSLGVYQSNMIDASSNFDYYIAKVILDYNENQGSVDVQLRVSYDGGTSWEEWKSIKYGVEDGTFDGDGIKLKNTKFQFKIIMNLQDIHDVSPQFKKISIILSGAFKIENTGDVVCLPEMWFKKLSNYGTMALTNETTGQTVILKDINKDETVYIDNENKDVKTDLPLAYRYSNHNKEWLKLQDGENIITGIGSYELEVRHEFKLLQG